jgi:hypothetical protein
MWKRDVVRPISWTKKWTGQNAILLETDGTIVLITDNENINFFRSDLISYQGTAFSRAVCRMQSSVRHA